jgi:DNA-binding MurR/RpiR family transcriptional regulator
MGRLNTLTAIKSIYPDATSSEKSIADYILEKPEEIYRLNIQELAARSNVSLPTVFRFAKRLGFKGFKDFKVALIRDIGVGLFFTADNLQDGDKRDVTRSLFEKEIASLRETLANLDHQAMSQAAAAIAKAERILFFAVSSSIPIALDFCWKFSMAGFTCFQSSDVYAQEIASKNTTRSDVAIGISFSGGSRETVRCMENARKSGTKTICVTTFPSSPITRHSSIQLFTAPVQALHQKVDFSSKISQTVILDALYLQVVLNDSNRISKRISMAEEELLLHRVK